MKKNNIRCHVLNYHIVWCTKYRFKVLKNKVEAELKELLENICSKYGYDLVEMETMPDHVHLFVSTEISEPPADVVRLEPRIFHRYCRKSEFGNDTKIYRGTKNLGMKGA